MRRVVVVFVAVVAVALGGCTGGTSHAKHRHHAKHAQPRQQVVPPERAPSVTPHTHLPARAEAGRSPEQQATRGRPVVRKLARAFSGPTQRVIFDYPWCPASCSLSHYHFTSQGGFPPNDQTLQANANDEQQAAYANVNIFAASWWGQGHATDGALPLILQANANLASLGLAGPDMHVSAYYEAEGNAISTTPGSPNPSSAQIGSDLTYLMNTYVNGPNGARWARVNGKPVIFVYGDGGDGCASVDRWAAAPGRASWFVVMKVFPGYTTCANQPDDWHQYGAAASIDFQTPFATSISPGFWLNTETTPRLFRSLSTWKNAIAQADNTNTDFEFITTLNEWNENTGVGVTDEWAHAYLDPLHAQLPNQNNPLPPSSSTTSTTQGQQTTTTTGQQAGIPLKVYAGTTTSGGGTITSSPAGLTCHVVPGTPDTTPICQTTFPSGTTVTLTETPDSGSKFDTWRAPPYAGTVVNGQLVVTLGAEQHIGPEFAVSSPSSTTTTTGAAGTFNVAVGVNGGGSGTITSSPSGISCGSTCQHNFPINSTITLTFTPATGSTFSNWSGSISSTSNPVTVPLDGAKIISANATAAAGANFTFITLGDSRDNPQVSAMSNAVTSKNPSLLTWTGDICGSYSDSCDQRIINTQGAAFKDKMFLIRGNHDAGAACPGASWSSIADNPGRATAIGATNFSGDNCTFSFDYHGSHFVGLDNPGGDVGSITSAQITWLDNDLTAADSRGVNHEFVFAHGPIEPVTSEHGGACASSALVGVVNRHHRLHLGMYGHEHINAFVHLNGHGTCSWGALTGHDFYEIINGESGAPQYTCAESTIYCGNNLGAFTAVTVNASSLRIITYNETGGVLHDNTITTSNALQPPPKTVPRQIPVARAHGLFTGLEPPVLGVDNPKLRRVDSGSDAGPSAWKTVRHLDCLPSDGSVEVAPGYAIAKNCDVTYLGRKVPRNGGGLLPLSARATNRPGRGPSGGGSGLGWWLGFGLGGAALVGVGAVVVTRRRR